MLGAAAIDVALSYIVAKRLYVGSGNNDEATKENSHRMTVFRVHSYEFPHFFQHLSRARCFGNSSVSLDRALSIVKTIT